MRNAAWIVVAVLMVGAATGQELPANTNKIKSLPIDQAKALGQHKRGLFLNGLTTLSDKAAAVLRANPEIRLPPKFLR